MNGLEIFIEEMKREIETRSRALADVMLSDYATYSQRFAELRCYRAILEDAKALYVRLLDNVE